MGFMTYEQFSEAQCNSNEDPVKTWNPEIHGPLRPQFFAIGRGDKWEMQTENDVPVYVPETHESVQNVLRFTAAKKRVEGQGFRLGF